MKPKNRKPTFFWQGVLILTPMLVLAKLGALALWQDKRMAQHEAMLRAQDAAEEAAQLIWNDLQTFGDPPALSPSQSAHTVISAPMRVYPVNLVARFSSSQSYYYSGQTKRIDIDRAGRLVFPLPYDDAPAPQLLDPRELSEAQRAAWITAREQEANAGVEVLLRSAAESYRQFLTSFPPTNFAAAAHFALGTLLAQVKDFPDAIKEFSVLTNQFPNSTSEAGQPLDTLARFKIFETQRRSGILRHEDEVRSASDDLLRHVIKFPSALTPEILRRIPAITNEAPAPGLWMINGRMIPWIPEDLRFKAEAEWKEQEQLRRIYHAARPMLGAQSDVGIFSVTNAVALLPRPTPPPAFWITLRTVPSFLEPPARPVVTQIFRKPMNREPEPAPLTPAWSNVMQEEARERGKRDSVSPMVHNWDEGTWHAGAWVVLDERWLIVRTTNDSTITLLCRNQATVANAVAATLKHVRMPEFLGASVRLANAEVISSNDLPVLEYVVGDKGGGQFWKQSRPRSAPAVLAAAVREEGGRPLLAVNIHLISPQLLYAQQEERAALFKLLIGASALASIIGFFTARRAFHKQLRLAEMKSNFVSSVSHELRAPIASVRLMAEGLERGKISEPAKQQEYFRFITQECRRLSSMIENVLDFARIEQGRKQYEFEPTDVAALVEKTVKLMVPYAAEHEVKLRLAEKTGARMPKAEMVNAAANATDAQSDSAWGEKEQVVANIDGQAIQQALVNLIDNAVKHSPGGKEVVVSLEIVNLQILISVGDHGPGIPATEHEKIFERFYRLGSELRRETPGVGIGLSIVKHVVEAHGGRVRVDSQVGKGSRFTMELPLTAEAQSRREAI
ncbi:MAG TPA: ATP-binding protein [Verrucomicrobiae bacterium]